MNHAYLPQQNHPPPASPGLAQQAPRRPPVQRPGITTTLTAAQRFGPRLQAQTPSSPRPGITPVSPFSHLPVSSFSPSLASPMASARTSVSSTAAYNPQEWAQHGSRPGSHASPSASGPVRRVGGRGEVTGMEGKTPSRLITLGPEPILSLHGPLVRSAFDTIGLVKALAYIGTF